MHNKNSCTFLYGTKKQKSIHMGDTNEECEFPSHIVFVTAVVVESDETKAAPPSPSHISFIYW